MVSDSDLLTRLREILQTSDLETATTGSVRRRLEADFGVDLSDRKRFVREQIDIFLQTLQTNETENEQQNQNDAVEEEGEENAEEGEEEEENESEGRNEVKKKRKGGGGFTKVCSLSQPLQDLVGEPALVRTEVVKRIWDYIKTKNLQDPKNKRNIMCDEAMRAVFRVNTINMFQMNKALSKHIWPLEDGNLKPNTNVEDGHESLSELDDKVEEREGDEEEEEEEEEDEKEEVKKAGKSSSTRGRSIKADKNVKKRGGGGFTKPWSLSPELKDFFGVSAMARTEVVKKLWEYIRKNNLQDPSDKRKIICDEKLRALFQVDSIGMFQMNKALSRHLRPLNEEDAPDDSDDKETPIKHEREEDSAELNVEQKRRKKGSIC